MYTDAERRFMAYWESNRGKQRRMFRQVLISIPVGLIVVIAIFINFFSGWYKRATMIANTDPSLIIILLIAGILIVAFYAIFSSYHKWETNENHYKELILRQTQDDSQVSQ